MTIDEILERVDQRSLAALGCQDFNDNEAAAEVSCEDFLRRIAGDLVDLDDLEELGRWLYGGAMLTHRSHHDPTRRCIDLTAEIAALCSQAFLAGVLHERARK